MADDVDGAFAVWLAARSRDALPSTARRARVAEKLRDPGATLLTVARDGELVGMLLAEPFRDGRGTGATIPDAGHISMVFVHPGAQRRGIGRELVTRLIAVGPWAHLSLWTGEANLPARALYAACGFVATDDVGALPDGRRIRRWERAPDAATRSLTRSS